MKKITTLFAAMLMVAGTAFASGLAVPSSRTTPAPAATVHASDIRLPVGTHGQYATLQDLANMKAADYEAISGQKMNWLNRLEFRLAQRQLRSTINDDGTINNRRLARLAARDEDGAGHGFHLGGFALGFLLGLIGVLIAYLIKDDKKYRRRTWAWVGWACYVVLVLILLVH